MNNSVKDCAESGAGLNFNGVYSRSDSDVF